jgi:PAS domain S-box-containing protein
MTTQLLNVLLVEDSPDDALLTLRELQKGGIQAQWERVDTRAGMERALTERAWDLVICDHLMPAFSSAGALDVVRKLALDLPFIIVSGAAPEDLVTAAMRQGAHDFIAKGRLMRLVPAVRRELKEADLRRDRRQMQSRLAENEQQMAILAAAVEQVADAIAITGPGGAIAYVNQAFEALTGFAGAQTQGCALDQLLGQACVAQAIRQAAGGSVWEGRLALDLEGRGARELDATFSPVRDPGSAVRHLVAVLRDVTKEVELERQLRQAQKMDALGQLAAGIAHDFNNVLTTILASAELIKCRIPGDSPLLPKVEAILHAGLSAAGLTRQILSFSRKTEEKRIPMDLTATVRDALQSLHGTLPAAVELVEELTSGVWVEGDPALILQVVLNLALNAVQAMGARGGTLQVSLAEEPGTGQARVAVLTVRDTGCGMDPSVQERMFEPFFTTKPAGEGTGLGLSMVHATVAKAGGSIAVQSAAGQGTRIRIQLPCASGLEPPREAADRSGRPAPAGLPESAGAKRILLAEDNNTTRAMVRACLERAGCQVQEARDGLEAWDLFRTAAFDLLLTDVVMPRMDGLELSQLVRKADPALPIALLTANDDQETMKSALNLGINRFLAKPFEQAELIACVEQLLTERSSQLDARRSLETARAVRQAQRSMAAAPEKGVPLYTLYEPLTDAGGDVFRCFRCTDGSIVFVLADVAGHSVSSSYAVASFLGMLSTFVGECYGLMALAPNQEPGEALLPCSVHGCGRFGHWPCDPLPHLAMKLNHAIQSGPFAEVPVCALLGLWTPATGRLQLLNAGIPHALHSRSGTGRTGPVRINGTPLGVFPETDLEGCVLRLEPGDRFLCGTDGFFEVLSPAGRPFQDTVTGQWEALAASPLDWALAAVCEAARSHGGGVIADDLLVVGFEQPSLERAEDELVLRLPSTPRAVDMACDRLQGTLKAAAGRWNLRQERRFDILLAVREALTNAVLHGNGNRPGRAVTLRCRPDPGLRSLVVSVADEGSGFDLESHRAPQDPLSERGRGIPIIRHHAQDLRMAGNELTMTFLLEEMSHDER